MAATTALRPAPPSSLSLLAFLVAALVCLPLVYIAYLAITADAAVWSRLLATRIPELLGNTVRLAAAVGAATVLLGVSLAWLVVRYDFPGRRLWEWALVLPLALPTYVLAYVYASLLGTGGPAHRLSQSLGLPINTWPSPYGLAGTTLVMTLDTFPFVYLLTRGALLKFNVSYEEAARVCGVSKARRLLRVTLPLLRPAIVAGLSLVILYVVSDFGAVSLLRYQTFTYAVYQQITGRYDHHAAAILSLLLVVVALIFLVGERWFRRRSRFYQTVGRYRAATRRRLGPVGAAAALVYLITIGTLAFGLPAALLIHWTTGAVAGGAVDSRFAGFVLNSLSLSALAATAAVLVGTPLAYLATRRRSSLHGLMLQAAYAGYVLPGPVGALALLVLFVNFFPFLYGSVALLVIAYVLHFLPAGLQSLEPALQQVTPNLEEAARSLGLTVWQTIRRVTFPLVRGGFVAAWVLVFLQCMKELPATLLLRPVGFDTLAIRVWLEASEEYYELAAPAALLIVVVTLPALLVVAKDSRAA